MTKAAHSRCDNCKFWEQGKQDWTVTKIGFGRCKGVRERWNIEDDAVAGMKFGDETGDYGKRRIAALQASRAYVQDGSQYMADLYTAPDFFCALYVAKDKTQ